MLLLQPWHNRPNNLSSRLRDICPTTLMLPSREDAVEGSRPILSIRCGACVQRKDPARMVLVPQLLTPEERERPLRGSAFLVVQAWPERLRVVIRRLGIYLPRLHLPSGRRIAIGPRLSLRQLTPPLLDRLRLQRLRRPLALSLHILF
jgi:hypothetical protein